MSNNSEWHLAFILVSVRSKNVAIRFPAISNGIRVHVTLKYQWQAGGCLKQGYGQDAQSSGIKATPEYSD